MPETVQSNPTISTVVRDEISRRIHQGVWPPGSKMPTELQLAEIFSVSRATIRSALQDLRSRGLVLSQQGRGTFVARQTADTHPQTLVEPLSPSDFRLLMEYRMMLEAECAKTAALRATAEDLQKLKHNYHEMIRQPIATPEHDLLDIRFHQLVADASQNPWLIQAYERASRSFLVILKRFANDLEHSNPLLYHGQLIDAISAGNSQLARDLMLEHLQFLHQKITHLQHEVIQP